MFRPLINSALRRVSSSRRGLSAFCSINRPLVSRSLFALETSSSSVRGICLCQPSIFVSPVAQPMITTALGQTTCARNVTKFSLNKGKRKAVKAVLRRFKRLHWGGWIRTYCGRQKKLFRKSARRRRRLRHHVLVNATQSWLLDKMVTKFWRKPKYWIDDPYTPYHQRDEFFATKRRTFKV